jgi:phosphate/sulfate permease
LCDILKEFFADLIMNTLYLFIGVVLFAFAISDLIVGVSNDAVNFLSSAIGSKAAPFRIIMVVAAIGIVVGAIWGGFAVTAIT